MAQLPRPLADVRLAVRRSLEPVASAAPGGLVLVAVSGGADSIALADATAALVDRLGLRAGLVTVDHGLQPESAAQADRVRAWGRSRGFDICEVLPVSVAGSGGPEAAARTARYTALDRAADLHEAAAILLGHTLDDQAETVLLGLVRGSGVRSVSGMPAVRGRYRRPLLGLRRSTTRAACEAAGLTPWDDPHNENGRYLRVRARRLLPEIEAALGPGVVVGLARTAQLARDDGDALDQAAAGLLADATQGPGLEATILAAAPTATRTRVLRLAALNAGVPGRLLNRTHIAAMETLVTAWRGQGPVSLPEGVRCRRTGSTVEFVGHAGTPVRHAGRAQGATLASRGNDASPPWDHGGEQ